MKNILRKLAIASLALAGFAAVGAAQNTPPVAENQRPRIRQGVRSKLQRRAARAQARRDRRAIKRLRRNNRIRT